MENIYHFYFDAMPCFLTVQNRDLRIIDANRRFRESFGSYEGRYCYQVYKHRPEKCEVCPVERTFRDGEPHRSEEMVTTRDGRQVEVVVYTTPIRNGTGEITSVMEMSTDITEIKLLQKQLSSIGLLISSIAHGIKGLLNGLDGGIYLVNTGIKNNDRNRIDRGWEIAERNLARIRTMVMDILYYTKDREPNWQSISADDLLRDIWSLMVDRAKKLNISLECDIASDAGEFEGDPHQMRSLLTNLIENSLDACRIDVEKPEHKILIKLAGAPEEVVFEIVDNGIGMDEETRAKAFTLFFSSKGAGGTGLGLFISNKIAQSHGGKITLESEATKGSRFVVELPRRRCPKHN